MHQKIRKTLKMKIAICMFLTTRQTAKIRNAFSNNISTDLKLSKAQISKIIESIGSFGSWLWNLEKNALTSIAIYAIHN